MAGRVVGAMWRGDGRDAAGRAPAGRLAGLASAGRGVLLRGFLPAGVAEDGLGLWQMYMQLVQVEQAFQHFKTDLVLRPIEHETQARVGAHILVAFLGYALPAQPPPRIRGAEAILPAPPSSCSADL